MIKIYILLLILLPLSIFGQQNLVPNPSFENHTTCPDGPAELPFAYPWFQPTLGTPDYFNTCSVYSDMDIPQNFMGNQFPHSGSAYSGFFACFVYYDSLLPDYREYCEVKLDSPLLNGTDYFVTFFISLADSMNYATDAIGAFFSNDTIKNDTGYFLNSITPQIENTAGDFLIAKAGWTKISKKYTATGGEQFLTIGNFKNRINTDTISVSGGSANVGQSDYWGGYYYIDDVCISTDSNYAETWTGLLDEHSGNIKIYPNPCTNVLFVKNINEPVDFSITNFFGEIVKEGKLDKTPSEINVSSIPPGIFYLRIDNKFYQKILIIH
jgi:OOP family OmpA-OmpF porin